MKIAFIAMSGVRAASEELNRIGMTLPGFVERSEVWVHVLLIVVGLMLASFTLLRK